MFNLLCTVGVESKMHRNYLILLLVCFIQYATANPAIEAQRQFHQVVNSNQCLKECMTPVQASNIELSVFKRANYSDYFLKLDQICDIITTARHCIDSCQVNSNPFALISMNAICSEKSRQDAKLLEKCFTDMGAKVHEQCVQICGDYEEINNQLHLATSTLKPEDQAGLQFVTGRTGAACGVMKCSARCAVDNFNKQCGQLPNGELAGNMIREIVERILKTHQMDLQVFGLMESMQKNTQPECNYLHTASVLFNPMKDMISQQVLRNSQKAIVSQQTETNMPQQQQPEQDPRLMANRLYVRVLKKQLQVLDKQLELINKQEQKLDANNAIQPQFNADNGMF